MLLTNVAQEVSSINIASLKITEINLELFLAVLGTVIACIQFFREIKEILNNRKERRHIKSLVAKCESMEKAYQAAVSAFDNIKNIRGDEKKVEEKKKIEKCAEDVKNKAVEMIRDMKELYRQLLISEENVSMANGFDRYINILRELFMKEVHELDDVVEKLDLQCENFKKLPENSDYEKEKVIVLNIYKLTDGLNNQVEEIYKNFIPYMREIRWKYTKTKEGDPNNV